MILVQVCKSFIRNVHTNEARWAIEKSLLAKLRKKTGYTFTNCKKALEMHNNDISKAEVWLQDQAQQLGWAKATKLEGRQTAQGLIGVAVQKHAGVIVELNCETDFVAKNDVFQNVADTAASALLMYSQKQTLAGPISKIGLDSLQLADVPAEDGKKLADHVALMIGTVGENASLTRAISLRVGEGLTLSGYVHPSGVQRNNTILGKVGALVAFKHVPEKATEENIELGSLMKGICQHIVGMDPKKIGTDEDMPAKNADEEDCLIHQEYLLDDGVTVKEVLDSNGLEVVEFKRFSCGEMAHSTEQPLELVETCQ